MISEVRKKPATKKSRMVSELSSAIIELVEKNGQFDLTKTAIVDCMVANAVNESTPKVMIDMMSSETANMLETYFNEVCKEAEDELGLPYHYTSNKWYRRKKALPSTEAEAREYVVMFGNGRTGKAAGVRFVTKTDHPDPMLFVSLKKQINVINQAIKTRKARVHKMLSSDSVGAIESLSLSLTLLD